MTNFDGIELHLIFLQTLMDFDGYQPIRILFWNDEMMFTKQKHMGKGKSVARKRNVTASRSAADMAFRSLVSCLSLSVVSLSQGAP